MTSLDSCAAEEGRKLYDAIWQDVGSTFFDRSKMADWASWRHRLDDEIVDRETARSAVAKMLASLGDSYTRLLSDEEVEQREEHRNGTPVSVVTQRIEKDNIGFLQILDLSQLSIVEQVEEGLRELDGCDAYIIELSGNGGGLIELACDCVEMLMPKGQVTTIRMHKKQGVVQNVYGLFPDQVGCIWTYPDGQTEQKLHPRLACLIGDKPVVVMFDGGTASSAEVMAAAILFAGRNRGRAIGIGKRTAGKGTLQNYIPYPELNTTIKVTYGRFYRPDDVWFGDVGETESNGIDPDIEAEGFDARINAALAHLRAVLGRSAQSAVVWAP